MAKVVIGVDPHKRMNAVVVVNAKGTSSPGPSSRTPRAGSGS